MGSRDCKAGSAQQITKSCGVAHGRLSAGCCCLLLTVIPLHRYLARISSGYDHDKQLREDRIRNEQLDSFWKTFVSEAFRNPLFRKPVHISLGHGDRDFRDRDDR